MPAKKSSPVKKAARGKKQIGLTSAIGSKATTIVVLFVMAGGIAIGARQRQQAAKAAKDAETTASVVVSDSADHSAAGPAAPKAVRAVADSTTTPVVERASARPAVTVTGCLERDEDGFRLKDTAGAAAPKSRSWKSGFLKKGNATVDVVDASHQLSLGSEVGHRVSVTGTMMDRQIKADAIRRVGSCKAS